MKTLLAILGLLAAVSAPALAQCKDCGCKEKCSPGCSCPHEAKPQ
jgi:hypothetical protein